MKTKPDLPPWTSDMSDGCSGLQWLRLFARKLTLAPCRKCCERHDHAYYFGGTREERLKADKDLRACFIYEGKMPVAFAQICFAVVRAGGIPQLRIKGVSWAWGNNRFVYDKDNK